MKTHEFNDTSCDESTALATGPAGELLSKHSAYYSKAFLFGNRPSTNKSSNLHNGSTTLIQLPSKKIAVTCSHVIQGFRDFEDQCKSAIAQIGDTLIDPIGQLIAEDRSLDLAVIELTEKQATEISSQGEIGSRFVDGRNWPPKRISTNEVVMLAGFPGKFRKDLGMHNIEFIPFCAAGIRVHSSYLDYFTCQFEREYWVTSFGAIDSAEQFETILGGMSGGPAFVDRGLNWEFGGFIYQHSPSFDVLYLRHADLIAEDGTIRKTELA